MFRAQVSIAPPDLDIESHASHSLRYGLLAAAAPQLFGNCTNGKD
jgi:hypothetical protein